MRLVKIAVGVLVIAFIAAGLSACVATPTPIGNLDEVRRPANGDIIVRGWAGFPGASRTVNVTATAGGISTTKAATLLRGDIGVAFPQVGTHHGYNFSIPNTSKVAAGNVCVTATDQATKTVKALGCKPVPGGAVASPIGNLDDVTRPAGSNITVRGWAGYPTASRAVTVKAVVGSATKSASTGLQRLDVARAYPPLGGNHGYSITVPGTSTLASGTVCVTVTDSVTNTSKALGCKPVPGSPTVGEPAIARYTGAAVTGPENSTFLYHTLAETQAAGQMANIGHPRELVYGTTNDAGPPGDVSEPAYAHSIGAKAYKYLQFTWFPAVGDQWNTLTWLGTTLPQRAPWAMCQTGNTPLIDAGEHSYNWQYADANEKGFVDAMLAWTARLKAAGYDGVFVDAAGRALRGPYWNITSSCTTNPVTPGAKSSDAWFALLMKIKAQGLKVSAMNVSDANAADPFLRADPARPGAFKSDIRQLDWTLHENAAHPKENWPIHPTRPDGTATFESEAGRVRNDALYGGGKVTEMAKARLAMNDVNRSAQEQYVWSIAKLAGGPVVLNAGFDFCGVPVGTTDCNRTGLDGTLTDIRLGSPIDAVPYMAACDTKGCMWVRRFQKGVVVVAAYGSPRRVANIPLGVGVCKLITEFKGGVEAGGQCVGSITTATSGGSKIAHIYLYS